MPDRESQMQGLASNEEMEKYFPGAVKVTLLTLASWQLTDEESRAVLNVDEATYEQLKTDPAKVQSKLELLERVSLLLGIRKALEILDPSERQKIVKKSFIKRPNSYKLFSGRPPLDLMVQGRVEDLWAIRRFLDGATQW
jgi:hypothetical protein